MFRMRSLVFCANQHSDFAELGWPRDIVARRLLTNSSGGLKLRELHEAIAKILRPLGDDIVAIFFDVDEGHDETERSGSDAPYTLSISLLYSTARNRTAAAEVAEKTAAQIRAAFKKAFFTAGKCWQDIELIECEPIADEALTYAMSALMKKWNLDYISLRETPETAMAA